MRALSAVDHVLLLLENHRQPMNIGGLCIFELPKDAPPTFLYDLVEQAKASPIKPTFPFNQILHKMAFWRADDDFDISRHLRHIALPYPADIKELMAYISREQSHLMNRSCPLWEFHLIDGLMPEKEGSPKRFAVWLKVHHAMTDGISAMRLIQISLSPDPDVQITKPFWSLSSKHKSQFEELIPPHKPLTTTIKEQLGGIYPVGRELLKVLQKKWQGDPNVVSTFDAPKSIFNQPIGSSRTLLARSFDKTRFARLAKHFDVTTNDVILAVCSGALRHYLISQNALPKKPLIAFVPVSLRRDNSVSGNQISFLLTNLGTHQSTPETRLATIKNSMDDGKQRFGGLSQSQIISYSALTYGWAGINLATAIAPTRQAFNLIISNVPAEKNPLYLNGARLTNIYPASVLFDGQALNITFINHLNTIDFGIVACPTTLPNIDTLPDFINEELEVFEKLLNDNPNTP